MTGFLASVKNAQEAKIALEAGATLIDAKNPDDGALGALPIDTLTSLIEAVAGQARISATVGDLALDDPQLHERIHSFEGLGLDYIKIGLFPPMRTSLESALAALPRPLHSATIAVILVDQWGATPYPIEFVHRSGFRGVMLDTADKHRGNLCAQVSLERLKAFVEEARGQGLLVGLAGHLKREDIDTLRPLEPDYLGFRSALCVQHNRQASLDREACLAIHRSLLSVPQSA